MAVIGNAIERGSAIYVYDERGHQLFTLPLGTQPEDGLKGYTSSAVNVRLASFIYTYDENGRQISTTSVS